MRLFALAVKANYDELKRMGMSETFASLGAVAEAEDLIKLSPEEAKSVKTLIKEGRLAELASDPEKEKK